MVNQRNFAALMAVYNVLACDGRVLRAAEALAGQYDLTVMGIAAGGKYETSLFRVADVALPRLKRAGPVRLLLFWMALIWRALRAKPDVIYANDFFLLFPGWVASRVLGARLIYDAHELRGIVDCGRGKERVP